MTTVTTSDHKLMQHHPPKKKESMSDVLGRLLWHLNTQKLNQGHLGNCLRLNVLVMTDASVAHEHQFLLLDVALLCHCAQLQKICSP